MSADDTLAGGDALHGQGHGLGGGGCSEDHRRQGAPEASFAKHGNSTRKIYRGIFVPWYILGTWSPALSPKRQNTRAKIIEATLALIAERGFAAVSLAGVAAGAGMTKGAIYSNFRGKGELLWAAAAGKFLPFRPVITPGDSLPEQARALARAMMAMTPQAGAEAAFYRELQVYIRTDPELLAIQAERQTAQFDLIATRIQAEVGDRLTLPARTVSLGIQAVTRGFLAQWHVTPDEVTEAVVAGVYEALLAGAIDPQQREGAN